MKNLFMSGYKKCEKCGKFRKNYPDFESQWTAIEAGGLLLFICPKCWGIPDPAPAYCKAHGHDYRGETCDRCGHIAKEKGNHA